MQRSSRSLVVGALLAAMAVSCGGKVSDGDSAGQDGWVKINYRGTILMAQKLDGQLLIEGDISVGASDLLPLDETSTGVGVHREELARIIGTQYKWASGVVAYSVTHAQAADQPTIEAGLNLWRAALPAVSFNKLSGACTGDCLDFTTSTVSNSLIGRQGGTQTINLVSGVVAGSVAHEVGHALGAWHEQSRSDRGSFVTVNWQNIQGCKSNATSVAGCGAAVCQAGAGTAAQNVVANGCCTLDQFTANQCYMASNFDIGSPQALVLGYDYDSVMHYPSTAFSKSGTTLVATQTLPAGVVLGQRSHLSVNDIQSMNALYPVQRNIGVLFRNTGVQPIVSLEGRQSDIDKHFSWSLGGTTFTSGTVDTSTLTEGFFTLNASIQSPFWALNYGYPNTTVTTWPSNGLETFTANGTSLAVLNAGLIPLIGPVFL